MLKDFRRLNEQEAQELVTRQVARIEDMGGNVTGALLRQGPPIDEILSLAEELHPGPVVIGSRGLGSVGSLLVGSVPEGLSTMPPVQSSSCAGDRRPGHHRGSS